MTGWMIAVMAAVAIAMTGLSGVQSSKLAAVRADLKSKTEQLQTERDRVAAAQAAAATARADKRLVERAVSVERDRAVAAERRASALREQIARDTGTARDAATAPVLFDNLMGLRGAPQ